MKVNWIILLVLLLPGLEGCVSKPVKTAAVAERRHYVTEFTFPDASARLESVTRSVSKLFAVAYYTTYQLEPGAHFRQHSVNSGSFKESASALTLSHETVSGTATLVSLTGDRAVFLTCAHILDFPDTVISFADPSHTLSTDVIKSIAIKDKQEIYCRNLPGCGPMEILALDRVNDIALIGRACMEPPRGMKTLEYPAGRASDLGWGSAAYVIGFPMGNPMITRGIVSNPNSDENGTFMIDALFNKGFSGGIILAGRKDAGFELVGMIRSAYSQKEYVLRPEKEIHEFSYGEAAPYPGEIHVGTLESINYGVTSAVPVESLRIFYKRFRADLVSAGYDLDSFFLAGEK